MSKNAAIIGVGNVLLKDDGAGVACIEYLEKSGMAPPGVKLVDGATMGLSLLDEIKKYEKVVVVDAVLMGKDPGSIGKFEAAKIISLKSDSNFSLHEIGLAEALKIGDKIGFDFSNVVIVGIEPKDVSRGEKLTDIVAEKIQALAKRALTEATK